ncbi:TetR/AcrR family transcriptional regulator [Cohaesibacter sp. ES.047]|uniref:TetR/AcrR family transcriptional regulator n=1 Tax=Cohaesibacter sp. ES.047 TaxID=1798205 RepID=UPI000BB7FF24|nr:TetR/AcrR family transcriptional regulator [Cohaesibacter sp. ES.047]
MKRMKKSDVTRQTILSTGRALVTKGGFGAMGLSTLLNESGVPKGSFYYYFPSKEAFGEAMLRDYVEDYLTRVEALMTRDGCGADKLMAFCSAWLDHDRHQGLVSTCLVVKLGAEVADLSETMRLVLDNGVKALVGKLAIIMREGEADGSLHPQEATERSVQVLYAQLLGAAIQSKLSHDQTPLEAVLEDIKARLIV